MLRGSPNKNLKACINLSLPMFDAFINNYNFDYIMTVQNKVI